MSGTGSRRIVFAVFALASVYAVVRYIVFKGVPADHWPLYIPNKIAAVAGLCFLAISTCIRDRQEKARLGKLGFTLTAAHLVMSVLLLKPGYFEPLFLADGTYRWQLEASLLCGVIGMVLLCKLCLRTGGEANGKSLIPGLGRWILLTTAAHVTLLGYAGWLKPASWPGAMPPLTLLSCGIALAAIAIRFRRK